MNVKQAVVGFAVAGLVAVGGVAVASPAQADDGGAGGRYATCDSQRWSTWMGPQMCKGYPWKISIKTECLQAKSSPVGDVDGRSLRSWWKKDAVCQSFEPRTYIVRKGDTLWRIAVRVYGSSARDAHAGQQWRKIVKLNRLRSTTIRVGQRLRVR